MFLRIHDELVNVNDIKTISIEEELANGEKSTRRYVIATTEHKEYVLDWFDFENDAIDLINTIAEKLDAKGLLIDV